MFRRFLISACFLFSLMLCFAVGNNRAYSQGGISISPFETLITCTGASPNSQFIGQVQLLRSISSSTPRRAVLRTFPSGSDIMVANATWRRTASNTIRSNFRTNSLAGLLVQSQNFEFPGPPIGAGTATFTTTSGENISFSSCTNTNSYYYWTIYSQFPQSFTCPALTTDPAYAPGCPGVQ